MNKIKQVIIAGASTFYVKNLGDDAMLLNLVQSIKRYDKSIKIILLARHPNKELDKMYGIKSIKTFEFDKRKSSIGNFFFGLNSDDNTGHLEKIKKTLNKSDAIILAGNLFMELFPNSFLKGIASYSAFLGTLAKFFNLKIYLTSVNLLNHTKSDITKQYLSFFSDNAKKVCVREDNSYKNFLKFKFNPRKLKVIGDTAFGIKINNNDNLVKKICPSLFKKNDVKFIGVCIRVEYWKKQNLNKIFKKYAKILSKLALKTNAKLIFIPNAFSKARPWMDDRVVNREIAKLLDKKVKYFSINQELNLFEVYNIISKLDMHITNRRHSGVFALSQKIQTIFFETSLKGHLKPLLNSLSLHNNIIDLENRTENIVNKILRAWKTRNYIRKIYQKKIFPLRKRVQREFNILVN